MRWLCLMFGLLFMVFYGCDDGGTDGDADGDGDADLAEEGEKCREDRYCLEGLSCHCENPPCINSDGDDTNDNRCVVCQPRDEACNVSTECCRDSVCVEHHCVPVFGREYEVQVLSAHIYPRTDRGYYWDHDAPEAERDPDPYAVVSIGETTYTTETMIDDSGPIWAESFMAHVAADGPTPYTVWIYDDDGAEDEVIMEFGMEDPPIWFLLSWNLRQGGLTITQGPAAGQTHEINMLFIPH